MKNRHYRTFLSLLISYILIMIFTVSIGILTYIEALKVVEKDASESNLSLLRQSSELIDSRLTEVDNIVYQVGQHAKIGAFLNFNDFNIDTEFNVAYGTWKFMQINNLTSNFIFNFYIYFKNSNIIMSSKDFSSDIPMYYDIFTKYRDMSYEEWYSEILGKYHNAEYLPAKKITINGKEDSYITYIQSLPLGYKSSFNGAIIILINEAEMHQLLYRHGLSEGGGLFITDANGKVLTSISDGNKRIDISDLELGTEGFKQQKFNGEDMFVSFYTSPVNKWKYISVIPTNIVMKKVDNIRKTNSIIIIAGLVIGILIAVFFANRNSKPVRAIIKKFSDKLAASNYNSSNEYNIIDSSLSRLINHNEALKSEIDKQMPLLRAALFDRLFRGEFNDQKEIEAALSNVGLNISANWYLVIVLRFDLHEGASNDNNGIYNENIYFKRVILKDLLSSELRENGIIHDLQQERLAVLLKFQQPEKDGCHESSKEFIEKFKDILLKQSDSKVAIGVGCFYQTLIDVYRSYLEASKAIELVDYRRGETILWYDLIPKNYGGYYYPSEVEQRLTNLVKAGNRGETAKLLEVIYSENINEKRISSDSSKLLLYDISATVYKIINEVFQLNSKNETELREINILDEYTGFFEHVNSFVSFTDAYEYISNVITVLCSYSESMKKSHNIELKDRIINYINNNYTDGNMSLANVASFFNISEIYLSIFFKEQTGENFSTYLENIRMQHARSLLMKADLTIDEIAGRVGYINSNTFYKAFKRIEGVSPGAFRTKF